MARFGRQWGWVVVSPLRFDDEGNPVVTVRARVWHPGFWLAVARAWWASR